MGSAKVTVRVVLDTNIVVSALLFQNGRLSWLRHFWQYGNIIPLVCKETVTELLRVFAYPKFKLGEAEIQEILGDFLPYAETVSDISHAASKPLCRDTDDQIFIDLALSTNADSLVTGDSDLLVLAGKTSIPIITPAELQQRLAIK